MKFSKKYTKGHQTFQVKVHTARRWWLQTSAIEVDFMNRS